MAVFVVLLTGCATADFLAAKKLPVSVWGEPEPVVLEQLKKLSAYSWVLDLGSGDCRNLLPFGQANFANLTAVDIDEKMLVLCRENFELLDIKIPTLIVEDARQFDQGRDHYDVIIISALVHWFTRAEAITLLKDSHDALRSGGRLIFVGLLPDDGITRGMTNVQQRDQALLTEEELRRIVAQFSDWEIISLNSRRRQIRTFGELKTSAMVSMVVVKNQEQFSAGSGNK